MTKEEIKALRQKLRLSQEKFAHRLGVCYGSVSRWERGIGVPSHFAIKLLKQLNKKA